MSENISKATFVNFLLNKEHNLEPRQSPIIESQIEALNAPDCLRNFHPDFSPEKLKEWLSNLETNLPFENIIFNDLAFAILYNSDSFSKLIKTPDFEYKKAAELYKNQFDQNKLFLKEFNSKNQSKINISAPSLIRTRFPPEPSGYLHIGHAKAALLNQMLCKENELIVRFDDTNPAKESKEFEDAILEDLKLLKITNFKLTRSSDHFNTLFEYAVKLIKMGMAYADNTPKEQMNQERMEGIESKCRNSSVEENLRIFEDMRAGNAPNYCLRAKISVDNPNKCMRDPVIYRSASASHQSTGAEYKIYPTYDFTVPIVDSIEGITLCLRTNEYRDRNDQYYWFINTLKMDNVPKIHDFSRLAFENTVISKRKMKFYVENNFVSGWNDPRLCTLRGLKRLGMDMDALREYIAMQGASQKTATNSWDKIWAMNKRTIDSKSSRYSAVPMKDAVLCYIESAGSTNSSSKKEGNIDLLELGSASVDRYKKNAALGKKTLFYTREIYLSQEDARVLMENEEFTLMNWCNAIVLKKEQSNGIVKSMSFKLNPEGDFKLTKNKITWVSLKGSTVVKFYEYGNLQNDVISDDLAEQYNKDSKKEEWWIAEYAVSDAKPGDYVQFERIGFYICDKEAEFNLIPFTKQKRSY
jgi:glutamyl-tRNA synthetase